jgi:hypothetical protein
LPTIIHGIPVDEAAEATTRGLILDEVWKVYPHDHRYEVSDCGRVRNSKTKRIRASASNGKGYFKIMIHSPGGIHKSRYLHRMVMETFIGDSDLEVSHLNGNPRDNRLWNLRYEDHATNMEHRKEHGTFKIPRTNKLTQDQVDAIRSSSMKGTELAAIYGVAPSTICAIRRGRNWVESKAVLV